MYCLRRLLAQVIDAMVLLLVGVVLFHGTADSPIKPQGKWHTFKPAPMYPTTSISEFFLTRSEHAQKAPPQEDRPGGYKLLQTRLSDGSEITVTHYPMVSWSLLFLYALYYSLCTWLWGYTAGKWAMRLKVVTVYGQPVSYQRALGRWLSYYVSVLPLYLGLAWIFVNRQQQDLARFDLQNQGRAHRERRGIAMNSSIMGSIVGLRSSQRRRRVPQSQADPAWNWQELSRYFLRKASSAQRRMWAIRDQAQDDATSRAEYDRALAVFSVCQRLWGQPFLRDPEKLIDALHSMLAEPQSEETPYDESRFARMWKDVVTALIWRYSA